MRLPDGTILMHGRAPYDPVKAHEYYMRTRKLKGRRKGAVQLPPAIGIRGKGLNLNWDQSPVKKDKIKVSPKKSPEQRYAEKRVNDIKKSVAKLGSELKRVIAEAKAQQIRLKAGSKKQAPKGKVEEVSATQDPVAELEAKISEIKGALQAAVAKQRELMAATKNG